MFDESTSSIATRTELKIQDAFARLMQGRTSFIVGSPPVNHQKRRQNFGDERRKPCGAGKPRRINRKRRFLRKAV